MTIRVKRIYDRPEPDDGVRILVDRLWPRGVRKDDARIDLWLKDAAPSTELRRWFHADTSRFAQFRLRYLAELGATPGALAPALEHLQAGRSLTLLYAARNTGQNHAHILAERLARLSAGRAGPRRRV